MTSSRSGLAALVTGRPMNGSTGERVHRIDEGLRRLGRVDRAVLREEVRETVEVVECT
jgi:hypothetical protein